MKFFRLFFSLILLVFMNDVSGQNIRPGKIKKLLKKSEVLNDHFTGFALYDLGKRKPIIEQQSHKYFTPASNTKLFTFYAGLKLLKDSIPGLQYITKGDSLIFWATGDPVFLHPDFPEQIVLQFLQNSGKKIYWANGRYKGSFYGTGWSYDDYNEYYQPEISELPMYGNIIRLQSKDGLLISTPPLPSAGLFDLFTDSTTTSGRYSIQREFSRNIFHQPAVKFAANYNQEVPFKTDQYIIDSLLKTVLPTYQGVIELVKPAITEKIYSAASDSVFRHMLLPSDNFMAEQLLLTYAAENDQVMSTPVIIDFMMKNHLSDLPDKPQWVDGSGLSRQDLFTPATMIKLCEKIYDEVNDEERLFNLLPQGGKTGTLRNYFKTDKPFVFGKTGTLSNVHNLSGYLKTRSGNTLIFSFMHNNYVRPTADIRKEMERILTIIHEKN
ncbi:MAG TPA: D-alanyl-D-alanine carboxypeptidase [Daejeonella sp.]|nr:D-alanyl-D-alanine carboxypeptidase [Daejeonella sp.]